MSYCRQQHILQKNVFLCFLCLRTLKIRDCLFRLGQIFPFRTSFSVFLIIPLPNFLLTYSNHSLCYTSSRGNSLYSTPTANPRSSLVKAFLNVFSPRLHPTTSNSLYIHCGQVNSDDRPCFQCWTVMLFAEFDIL